MKSSFEIEESQLPAGWLVAQVKQIAEIVRGVTYEKADARDVPCAGYTPVLRATNIQDSSLILDKDLVFVPTANVSDAQMLRTGDIVVATSSGSKHLVGKTAQVKSDWNGSFGAFCAAIRPVDGMESRYFGYFLESPAYKSFIAAKAMGVNINNLRHGDLEEIRVPIAPLNEQTRIVAEIEKQFSRLDEAVANLKRVKANLKRYKAAVLKAAVEGKLTEEWRRQHPDVEPADKLLERILAERRKAAGKGKYKEPVGPDTSGLPALPAGWVWAKSDQLLSFVTSGSRGWASYYSEAGPAFLRMGNLDHDTIDLDLSDIQRVTPPQASEGTRTRVVAGDILISITADVGMVGLVPEDFEEAYINQHVALARPACKTTSIFFAWFLASKTGQKQFTDLQRGATKVGLGLDDIKAVIVPLPPLAEQNQIVAEVERRLSIVAETEVEVDNNLRRADRLRQSILKQAFSGQLVPQDPNDEPASVLLERIRENANVGARLAAPKTKSPNQKWARQASPLRKPEPVPVATNAFPSLDAVLSAILGRMQPGKEYSRADLVDPLGLSTGRWTAAIQELKRRGHVRQVGEKRGARYTLFTNTN